MDFLRIAAPSIVVIALGLGAGSHRSDAQEIHLRVNIFPGPQNIALFAAKENGFFAKRGLAVDIQITSSSDAQRNGLAKGEFEIAQSGVDNAVALVEVAKVDVVIVAGGGNGMNEFIVRPEINSFADLRGKKIVVDAPNTAFAFLGYKMLALNGLKKGEYGVLPAGGCPQRLAAMRAGTVNAAAMLNLPCSVMAKNAGYRSLGNAVAVLGAYQADGIFVLRSWAKAHSDILVKYLQGVIEGYRWAADPAHRDEAAAITSKVLKLDIDVAVKANDIAVGRNGGLASDARFDMDGFKNTLKLRSEMEGGDANEPQKYLDLTYYRSALAGL